MALLKPLEKRFREEPDWLLELLSSGGLKAVLPSRKAAGSMWLLKFIFIKIKQLKLECLGPTSHIAAAL